MTGVPSTALSDLYSCTIGTSRFSTIQCMGIATHSTIDKMRLSSAPPWEAVSLVRKPASRGSWGALMTSLLAAGQWGALCLPGTEEPGGLPSMGSHRVGHDWSDLAAAAACLPEIQALPNLARNWGYNFFSSMSVLSFSIRVCFLFWHLLFAFERATGAILVFLGKPLRFKTVAGVSNGGGSFWMDLNPEALSRRLEMQTHLHLE